MRFNQISRPILPRPKTRTTEKLPAEVPAAATRPGLLDQVLDSPRNPVPPIPVILLLLGLGVDQRKSSSKFCASALYALFALS